MNKMFISKMLKAKQLELEALAELLPENVQRHMSVIGNELKVMAEETIINAYKDKTKTKENKTVNKINIE